MLDGAERTIIADIFNIIQKVRDTGIHLKVDEEQWKITRGSKRQASGYGPRVCDVRATAPRYSSSTVKKPQSTRLDRKSERTEKYLMTNE